MRRGPLVAVALVLMSTSVLGGVALAQDSSDAGALVIEEIDESDYPSMRLVVSVPLELVGTALTGNSFTVLEGTVERPVTAQRLPTDDLQVVLLLDASTSMSGEPIEGATAAALGFVEAMPAGVEIAVVAFASAPEVLSDFTTDHTQAAEAIVSLDVGGETALYDGLTAGAELFEPVDGQRRVLVLLSDGGDTVSDASLGEAISGLLEADVGFFAVELQSPENDSAALVELSEETGGVVVPALDPDALAQVFDSVAGLIVNRYELKYSSEAFGLQTVALEVHADGVIAAAKRDVRFPDPPPPSVAPSRSEPAPTPSAAITPSPSPVALRQGSTIQLAWWQSPTALWFGVVSMFVALSALFLSIGLLQQRRPNFIVQEATQRVSQSGSKILSSLAEHSMQVAERILNRGGRSSGGYITTMLENAGLHLRPGELVVTTIASAIVTFALGLMLLGPPIGTLFAAATLVGVRLWLGRRTTKRQRAFADQLADVLQLMSGSVRAGFGLMQAIDSVATEVAAPAGEEFQRVKIESQLGRDRNEALLAMAKRVGNEDFKWVVEAIEIHHQVGGDLADILDAVTETVRDRNRIRRRIETLSAEGKVTGMVLMIMPFALAGVILAINPTYLSELVTTGAGQTLIAAGFVAMIIGTFWIRRITSLKY